MLEVNKTDVADITLVSLLLTLNKFEQVTINFVNYDTEYNIHFLSRSVQWYKEEEWGLQS